jgi:hypothetical protein
MYGRRGTIMLEAFYLEQRDLASGPRVRSKHVRWMMQAVMGIGAIVFFVVAVSFFNDPMSVLDSATNEPVGVWGGRAVAGAFGLGSIVFAIFSWASRWMPIDLNGTPMVDDLPTGLAWQMSPSGVKNPSWGDATVPWNAISHVKNSSSKIHGQRLNIFFSKKADISKYLGDNEALSWNLAVSYALDIETTNIDIATARAAISKYCPRIL